MAFFRSKEQKAAIAEAEHEELARLREKLAEDKAAGRKRDDVAYWRVKQLEQRYPDTMPGYDPAYYKYGAGAGVIKFLERGIERQREKANAARARRDAMRGSGALSGATAAPEPDGASVQVRGVAAAGSGTDVEADAKRRLAEKFGK